MSKMKIALGKIVNSRLYSHLRSIRGPEGHGDSVREHLTKAGFEVDDEVAIVLRSDLDHLCSHAVFCPLFGDFDAPVEDRIAGREFDDTEAYLA